MDEVEIRCPYCNSSDVEHIGSLDCEINLDGGGEHSRYRCSNESCDEIFYVIMIVDIAEIQVGKERHVDYKVIYSK
ncbi:hypothetical protein NQ830_12205 [Clostridioides difficile]|uniref:hypothetical protein n=1 Tax=Clostridioides difficile TaxID=1496 RepID=UPI00038CFCDE|nr:hypothetical protein [Clostridioides difficile]EQJ88726.1 hypothetical protein QUC_3308 [Clostridioides difficile P50]MCO8835421.1 hypothetical protein [Clostridioides difficile]MCR1410093.1 hypothetical protein [Clostridioides difficile]MCR1421082.1 hypothetical protein [Clostridioides difficile]MDI0326389.1 hypothetical protein [Clostridioides difficile]